MIHHFHASPNKHTLRKIYNHRIINNNKHTIRTWSFSRSLLSFSLCLYMHPSLTYAFFVDFVRGFSDAFVMNVPFVYNWSRISQRLNYIKMHIRKCEENERKKKQKHSLKYIFLFCNIFNNCIYSDDKTKVIQRSRFLFDRVRSLALHSLGSGFEYRTQLTILHNTCGWVRKCEYRSGAQSSIWR